MPLSRALEQLGDPIFMGVVLRSAVLAAAAFVAAGIAAWWALHDYLRLPHWAAGLVGGLGSFLAAIWLFAPLGMMIAALYAERICAAVDRRYYPHLPPPHGASTAAQLWDGLALGLVILLYTFASLILALILPGIGAVFGWLLAAWALARGYFTTAAMRRMPRHQALMAFRYHRFSAMLVGAACALAGLVPLLNLFVPVLATAAMVHVLHADERDD